MKIIYPLKGDKTVVNGFGPRESFPVPGGWTLPFHYGVDWSRGEWTPIYAAHDGVVTSAGWDKLGNPVNPGVSYGGGWTTQITNGDWSTWYLHQVKAPSVQVGQRVRAGDLIGYVGTTGLSTGPHLHFEYHYRGVAVNPEDYLTDTVTPARTPEEEDENMAAAGFYYTRKRDNAIVYLIVHGLGSGVYHEYSNGAGGQAMPSAYNNAIAAAFNTGSFISITESHAGVIKRAEDTARREHVTLDPVTIENGGE